ncbi:PA14 domain-containing protein [Marinobacter sp. X15-166B]|uniref:PA14 domain-containing protein n=1 Tax=Marinobacter sp. X15-166B TaxID=1897620 RepID=UPI00085BFB1F|nr:PA14 domain-containing protein [Marinobacter sp. X15-166B]OEY67741.1 hypothetical protein BG841_15765 [Marinobacter sp. X15-166B]
MKLGLLGKTFSLSGALIIISGCQSFGAFDPNTLPPSAVVPTVSEPGTVELRFFDNIAGSSVSNLTRSARFPDNPSRIVVLTSLETRDTQLDHYGALARGFIQPPATGRYRFYVSGDDQVELWLSPSAQPADVTLIATAPGFTEPYQYDKYSSQTSPYQSLDANNRYYFEVRHKESTGMSHFSVAWEGAGYARTVVGRSAIASWSPAVSGDSTSELTPEAYPIGYNAGFVDGSEGFPFNATYSRQDLDRAAYAQGYRIGFVDGSEDFPFDASYPPLDQDRDGLYDTWETLHGLDPADLYDARTDPDGDLLSAADEFFIGTHENNPDTDGDRIPDGVEVAVDLNPLDRSDAARDMDGDGYSSLEEYLAGTNSNDATSAPDIPSDPESRPAPPDGSENPANTGSASLSWARPEHRLDGTAISVREIEHYKIHYGQDRRSMNNTVTVSGTETSYVVRNLSPGIWYFTVTVFDREGRASPPSDVVSKRIQ